MHLRRSLLHYFWPVICGLLIAALIVATAPSLVGIDSGNSQTKPMEQIRGDWSGPVSYSEAARRAAPSVVNIYTAKTVVQPPSRLLNDPFLKRFFNAEPENRLREERSLGSGVIISSDGYILTNKHVISGADTIKVVLFDGREANASVSGVDTPTDLAVLRIELDGLKSINIGDPNSAQVGDIVLAIGNPLNYGHTVTQGIISAKGRNLGHFSENFLQTDAAINSGNSGGALVDIFGNLLGINSRKPTRQGAVGLGFAIPADIALKVVKDIVEYGKVIRGWVGIQASPELLSEKGRETLQLRRDAVLMVNELVRGGPAHRAGMEVGDLLLNVNGLDVIDGRRVSNIIADTKPGSKLEFEVYRRNQRLKVMVTAEADERVTEPF